MAYPPIDDLESSNQIAQSGDPFVPRNLSERARPEICWLSAFS